MVYPRCAFQASACIAPGFALSPLARFGTCVHRKLRRSPRRTRRASVNSPRPSPLPMHASALHFSKNKAITPLITRTERRPCGHYAVFCACVHGLLPRYDLCLAGLTSRHDSGQKEFVLLAATDELQAGWIEVLKRASVEYLRCVAMAVSL